MAPVHEHGNSERPQLLFITGFRYVHALDRAGLPRRNRLVHAHRDIRPGFGSQCDFPVNPRGFAPSIALRHLPHADQRVRPVPHHQLLQVPDLGPVLLLRRLEDPLPQPPYLPLLYRASRSCPTRQACLAPGAGPPVRSLCGPPQPRPRRDGPRCGRPIPGWRSCNPSSRLTCPLVPAVLGRIASKLTCHTSARFRARARGPVSGQLCSDRQRKSRPHWRSFPAAFRPPAFASWASCPARGLCPSYDRPTAPPAGGADPSGVSMFRTHETRLGPGVLSTPGTAVPARSRSVLDRRLSPLNDLPLSPCAAFRHRTFP